MADYRVMIARAERVFSPPAKYIRLFLLLLIFVTIFAFIAELVETGAPLPIDLSVTQTLQQFHSAWFDELMRFLTTIGYQPWVLISPLVVLVFALIKRNWAITFALLVALLGCLGDPLIKIIVHRPRPAAVYQLRTSPPTDFSFPSGHAATSMIIFGFLLYLACIYLHHKLIRAFAITLCVLLIFGIGLSRIYLGEHWFSDVLGGYVYGLAWLTMVVAVYQIVYHLKAQNVV